MDNKYSRREFLKKSTVLGVSLSPLVSYLSGCTNFREDELTNCIETDEFHYFDNNLTNLHFYFINAKIDRNYLKPCKVDKDTGLFMIVKIPQQHISEELIREDKFEDQIKKGYTSSKISGFSYLAFSLFPNRDFKGKRRIDLSKIENLLDWSNRDYFELIIPEKDNYQPFKGDTTVFPEPPDGLINFERKHTSEVEDQAECLEIYKNACQKLFKGDFYPFTLLEIPEGLLVTPYKGKPEKPLSKDGKTVTKEVRTIFSRPPLEKKQFVYSTTKGRVVRSVQEIWNTQIWFQQFEEIKETTEKGEQITYKTFGEKYNPSLRPVGYLKDEATPQIICKKNGTEVLCECPEDDVQYLPTFLDKQELTYIASLGRENANNEGKEWNIETKGLTFTGLGTIARFHYKNFKPPAGTDLAEYEHHITLGRDEYIKVARIGVLSVTGQRALHVKIGQRKIRNGVSYMEFKEYIEIIQKELNYFDSALFIEKTSVKEPQNYIQARKNPKNPASIIHSKDDPTDDGDDVWDQKNLWTLFNNDDQPALPDKWKTHYRRWFLQKVLSVTVVSKPIDSEAMEAASVNIKAGTGCKKGAFWLVLEKKDEEGKHRDCYLDFIGYDWNNNEIPFSSTCMFIRKMAIEIDFNSFGAIHKNFIDQHFERRHVQFINSEIALTADYTPKDAESKEALPNKSNKAKTDFIEYYFSLCLEPTGITIDGPKTEPKEVFNERFFPLYPQVKRAKLYVENIQSYAPGSLPSIVEYNDDYVQYGFEGKKEAADKHLYNKGKLVFNHTTKFLKGETITEITEKGKQIETNIAEGYKKIKSVFGGAGDAIGGLVNPDFDIQSIGLIKQSIAVGKDINKKYEGLTNFTDKFENFNPSDLLRQAPEIFNGISLLDILREVFPEAEGPINEIKNVAGQIRELRDDIINNPVYVNIKERLRQANEAVKNFIKAIEDLQKEIDDVKAQLKLLKDKLNLEHQLADIENFVESAITRYRIEFLKLQNGIISIVDDNIDKAVDFLVTEALAKVEVIYPYWEKLQAAKKILNDIQNFKLSDGKGLSAEAKALIQKYLDAHLKAAKYALIDFEAVTKDKALKELSEVKRIIKDEAQPYYDRYKTFAAAVADEIAARKTYVVNNDIAAYNTAKNTLNAAASELKKIKDKIEQNKASMGGLVKELEEHIKAKKAPGPAILDATAAAAVAVDEEIINRFKSDIAAVTDVVQKVDEILDSVRLPHFIDIFEKAVKDFEIIKARLLGDPAFIEDVITTFSGEGFLAEAKAKRKELSDHYQGKYDTLRSEVDSLVRETNGKLEPYHNALKVPLQTLYNSSLFPQEIKDLRAKVVAVVKDLKDFEDKLKEQVRQYEDLLKKEISQQAEGLVKLVKDEVEKLKQELLSDPENQELIDKVIQARNLYNILTTLSRKDINYRWQTTSFKNADLGIVSFIASSDPKTSLTVDVKNSIHFQPSQFPAVVSKVESSVENRLTNFGISLLKAIIINFNEVSFVAGTNQPGKFEVKIRDVQFAGAFAFVQALEKCFKDLLGDNFKVSINPTNVEISYLLQIPFIGAPSFGFRDIIFQISYTLHFINRPMELGAGIGTLENKTKLSVGIYTGLFYFFVKGNPKEGITTVEVSLEFGGYFGLSLGPLRGEVKLVVGLYYRKDPSGVIIEGYFLCEGRVKLWWVMISARFYMGVRSQGGYVEGRCTVSYEVSLGAFFKLSFSATYYKKFAGASPGNSQSGSALRAKERSLLTAMNNNSLSALSVQDREKVTNMDSQNTLKRKVRSLTLREWDDFINSYID